MNLTYSAETVISGYTNKPIVNGVTSLEVSVYWCSICSKKLSSPISAFQHISGQPHKKKASGNSEVDLSNKKHTNTNSFSRDSALTWPGKEQNKMEEPSKSKPLHPEIDADSLSGDSSIKKRHRKKKMKELSESKTSHPEVNARNLSVDSVLKEPVAKKKKDEPVNSKVVDPNLTCADCNLVFSSLHDTIQHFKHTNHLSMKKADAAKQKVSSGQGDDNAKESDGNADQSNKELKCEICHVALSNSNSANEHYNGKKHAKAVRLMEEAKEREILSNWQSPKPPILSNRDRRGLPNMSKRGRGRGMAGSVGGHQPKVLPGFVRTIDKPSNYSQQVAITQPNYPAFSGRQANVQSGLAISHSNTSSNNYSSTTAYVKPLKNIMSTNSTFGGPSNNYNNNINNNYNNNINNNNDNSSNSNNYNYYNYNYNNNSKSNNYNKHNEIPHNTPYNIPPTSFDNKSSEYTSTSKGVSQYQTSGYFETNRAPSPRNVNNCEQSNYQYSNSASNAPSTQGTDRYNSVPPPATNNYYYNPKGTNYYTSAYTSN